MLLSSQDLKWNINFFAENQKMSYGDAFMSREWEETTMAPAPKPKDKPWHAGRGPWAEKIDTSAEALDESFARYGGLTSILVRRR